MRTGWLPFITFYFDEKVTDHKYYNPIYSLVRSSYDAKGSIVNNA